MTAWGGAPPRCLENRKMVTVARLCRYPVKGLNAQELDEVSLAVGAGLPEDRRFAIAHGSTRFDGGGPEWKSKDSFLNLKRNERLALLRADYDEASGVLILHRDGKPVARGNVTEPLGRQLVEQFLAAFLGDETRGAPKIVAAPAVSFTDTREDYVSIINLASAADIERVVRQPVDPMRFRGNIYLDGAAPWREASWPGRNLRIGGAKLRVVDAIERCAATNVDPATGDRDLNIPKALMDGFRHADCGVYAEVVEAGDIEIGSDAELL
jgi:uncharacterized protein YcbX